jgi:hypothetical protein
VNADVAAAPVNPQLYLPDLVPYTGTFVSVCSWDESQGQTCESQCPPIVATIPIGTKNISNNRDFSGPLTIRVLTHPAGNLVKEWSASGVPAAGTQTPAWSKRTIVRCSTGTSISTPPPPNHSLVVQTSGTEADKNNNAFLIYVHPDSQLGP